MDVAPEERVGIVPMREEQKGEDELALCKKGQRSLGEKIDVSLEGPSARTHPTHATLTALGESRARHRVGGLDIPVQVLFSSL